MNDKPNTKDIEQQIAELEALDKARTQGSWYISACSARGQYHIDGDGITVAKTCVADKQKCNAKFIAAAPTMMQLIRTLHAENQKKDARIMVAMGFLHKMAQSNLPGASYEAAQAIKQLSEEL